MKRILTITLIGAALAAAFASPLMAADVASVAEARREIARNVASLVNDPGFDKALRGQLSKNKAMLNDVLVEYTSGNAKARQDVSDTLHDLDRQAIHLRGLDGALDALVDLRVSGPGDRPPASIRQTWTGTFVKNEATGQKDLVAYDPSGTEHRYPADAAPDVPMLLVESKNNAATGAGVRVMNDAMRREGFQSGTRRATAKGADGQEDLTILTDIYLTDDREPITALDADIFAVVSGVGPEGKAEIVSVDLPWLDHDKRWYNPRQDLITWRNFGANYVNVQLFEDDGDTNFKEMVTTVVGAVGDLSLLVAPTAPPALIVAGVTKIANEIIKVLPGKWFENSADYIDSFYVIERGSHFTRENPLVGARGWAQIGIRPYVAAGGSFKTFVDKTETGKVAAKNP
ncbi:DUF3103 family protein [Luteibacter yeojuensis]|uniref:DUF3103 family protein n=1 Tax=Luteibacter yeojuensis TaxID=345309 RepID=A0A7X5QUN1_9GAMM|nr:DUF3103 family protein [Luteibacter yeojuensis]NID15748.1 DUF3103 family protein [Luteibacter yeojuensis]